MKALIIGCGYVGTALGELLVRAGHTVYGVRRGTSAVEDLRQKGIMPLHAHVNVPEQLTALPACDWVVFCVSATGAGPEAYHDVYVQGTRNVLTHLQGAPPSKFVYTSSTGVYGQDDGSVVDESSPTIPASPTGKILMEAEQLILDFAKRKLVPGLVLRLAGIYGPGRGYWLRQFLAGEAQLEGDGGRKLNMIHRDDAAGAIFAALQHGEPGRIYNVVDNEPVKQVEMFKWLAQRLGRELPASIADQPLSKRVATNKAVSNQRLRVELHYQFKYPTFREGFQEELRRL